MPESSDMSIIYECADCSHWKPTIVKPPRLEGYKAVACLFIYPIILIIVAFIIFEIIKYWPK
jgi:hypothetical protein